MGRIGRALKGLKGAAKSATNSYPEMPAAAGSDQDLLGNAAVAASMGPADTADEAPLLGAPDGGGGKKGGLGKALGKVAGGAASAVKGAGKGAWNGLKSGAEALTGGSDEIKVIGEWKQNSFTEADYQHLAAGMSPQSAHSAAARWATDEIGVGKDLRADRGDSAEMDALLDAEKVVPDEHDERVTNMMDRCTNAYGWVSRDVVRSYAMNMFSKLSPDDVLRYREMGLSMEELMAVYAYTGDFAYIMNAVLRGQIDNDELIRELWPWIELAKSGMAKLPRGSAKNHQGTHRIDDTQEDDAVLDFDTVYRVDVWKGAFSDRFLSDYHVGSEVTEPAFLSTSVVAGAYGRGTVERTIHGAEDAVSVHDLSEHSGEAEALLLPGTKMRIDGIRDEKGNDVGDPSALYDGTSVKQHQFQVDATVTNTPAASSGKGQKTTDGEDAADAVPGPLEQRVASTKGAL